MTVRPKREIKIMSKPKRKKFKQVVCKCGHPKSEHYSHDYYNGCRHCEEDDARAETGICNGYIERI